MSLWSILGLLGFIGPWSKRPGPLGGRQALCHHWWERLWGGAEGLRAKLSKPQTAPSWAALCPWARAEPPSGSVSSFGKGDAEGVPSQCHGEDQVRDAQLVQSSAPGKAKCRLGLVQVGLSRPWTESPAQAGWSCSGSLGGTGDTQPDPTVCPQQQYQNGESEESHAQFLKALQNAVTTFVNRMKSNHVRGRSITNDSAVLSLFQSINSMHPQLLELLNQLDERRRRCLQGRGAFC